MDNILVMMQSRFYYAPVAHVESDPSILIQSLGIAEKMPAGHVYHPPNRECGLLMHFHDPVEVELDGRLIGLPAETTIIWPARCARQYGHPDQSWTHSWMNLGGVQGNHLLTTSGIPLAQPMNLCAAETFVRYLSAMCEELDSHVPPDTFVITGLTHLLFHELFRLLQQHATTSRVPIQLRTVQQFISHNLHRPIRLDELARQCHLSVSQFSALFSRSYGISAMSYVQQVRMNRAAMLLAQPGQNIAHVAAALGYRGPLHFSRRFKQHHSLSPTAYRRLHLSSPESTADAHESR